MCLRVGQNDPMPARLHFSDAQFLSVSGWKSLLASNAAAAIIRLPQTLFTAAKEKPLQCRGGADTHPSPQQQYRPIDQKICHPQDEKLWQATGNVGVDELRKTARRKKTTANGFAIDVTKTLPEKPKRVTRRSCVNIR